MRQVATHTLDYVDATMTSILSPDILPIEELIAMLRHIEVQLPLIMHLPISSDNTLHFYRYLKTHILVADGQFLLFIDVPIQNRANFRYMRSLTCQFHMVMYQQNMKSMTNIYGLHMIKCKQP